MNTIRIEKLKDMLQENPADPFLIYALATEFKTQAPDKALTYFEKLLNDHEDYAAAYYHAAQLYLSFEKITEAEAVFKKGLKVLESADEPLLLRELRSAYEQFEFEYGE